MTPAGDAGGAAALRGGAAAGVPAAQAAAAGRRGAAQCHGQGQQEAARQGAVSAAPCARVTRRRDTRSASMWFGVPAGSGDEQQIVYCPAQGFLQCDWGAVIIVHFLDPPFSFVHGSLTDGRYSIH